MAFSVAGQLGVPFFRVSAPELVSGMSGESEGRIRTLFKTASVIAQLLVDQTIGVLLFFPTYFYVFEYMEVLLSLRMPSIARAHTK